MAEKAVASLTVVHGGATGNEGKPVASGNVTFGGGSGTGGGSGMDAETKNYLDANIRAVSAENNALFARLEAKIDNIQPGATWQQTLGASVSAVVVGLGIVFAVLAYASDRFDSGIAAMGAIDETLDAQSKLNESQEARLDRIIDALEAQSSKPNPASEETEN